MCLCISATTLVLYNTSEVSQVLLHSCRCYLLNSMLLLRHSLGNSLPRRQRRFRLRFRAFLPAHDLHHLEHRYHHSDNSMTSTQCFSSAGVSQVLQRCHTLNPEQILTRTAIRQGGGYETIHFNDKRAISISTSMHLAKGS